MIARDQVQWTLPNQCSPGQVVLVHYMWTPFDDSNEWKQIPPHPADVVYGYWAPVPWLPHEEDDPVFEACTVFMKALLNLFQEDANFAVLTCMGEEVRIPWDQQYLVAICPGES